MNETDENETTNPEGAGPAADTATAGDAPPQTVSLDVVTAMHGRLVQLRTELRDLVDHVAKLDQLHTSIAKMVGDEIAPELSDLKATVTEHAEQLDGHEGALAEIGRRLGQGPRRGEMDRRLPSTPAISLSLGNSAPATPGNTDLEVLSRPSAYEAGKVTPLTEVQIDPSKVGTQIVRLPSGGELQVNVRRPDGQPGDQPVTGYIRDGKPTAGARTRRG